MNELIKISLKKMKEKKILNPEIDLRLLLNHSSNQKKPIYLSNFHLQDINIEYFNHILEKRLNYEPISKIINKKYFWSNEFFVNENVLDPRPETELIIEEVLKIIKDKKKNLKILDIGTGSGCIAISLAKELKNSYILGIDISSKAIEVAKKNSLLNECSKQIDFKVLDINNVYGKFDLIVSNPPYLSKKEYEKVQLEIKKYEPKVALLGGEDGLMYYRIFSKKIEKIMKSKSYFICEIGYKQLDQCMDIFAKSNLILKKISKDLQNINRTLTFLKI